MFAFGLQHLVLGKFVSRIIPGLPAWVPAQAALAYLTGAGLIVASIAMLFDRKRARIGATMLGAFIILAFLVIHVPRLALDPFNAQLWTFALKCLSLAGCAFAVIA